MKDFPLLGNDESRSVGNPGRGAVPQLARFGIPELNQAVVRHVNNRFVAINGADNRLTVSRISQPNQSATGS